MGLLDTIGESLDSPWSAVGVAPERISADPWARRGMVLSALGSQIIPAWEQGHKPFYSQLNAMGNAATEREWEAQKRAYAQAQAQAQAAQQARLAAIISGGGQGGQGGQGAPGAAPLSALADVRLGPPGPTLQRAAAASAAPTQQALTYNQEQGARYRRAAAEVAATNPEMAEKYMKLAEQLDPREEYYAATEGADGMFQATKYGSAPRALGIKGKPPELPSEVRAVEYALGKTIGGTGAEGLGILDKYRRSGAAGGTTVNLPAAESKYDEEMAKIIAKQTEGALTKGTAAYDTIRASHQLLNALDSGKVISGTGAEVLIDVARLGQYIGVGGKNGAEVLANTSKAMQAMAAAELSAAQENRGLGQLTENERLIVRKSALGDISRVPEEMRMLASGLEKLARHRIKVARGVQEGLARRPSTAGLAATFSFEDPPAYVSPKKPAALDPDEWSKLMPSVRSPNATR
jgi:hypothetical protein